MNLYVYAFVLPGDAPGGPLTIARHRLEILSIAGIDVAIERRGAAPSVSEAALRLQHRIVEGLGQAFAAVLPARFGSFVPLEELEQIVRLRRTDLRKALRMFKGRVQMTIRIVTAAGDAPTLRTERASSGTGYLNARRAALSGLRPPLAVPLSDAVRAIAHDERIETDVRQGRTALFHLIDRIEAQRYRASIGSVPVPEGARVTVSGPYAPFAFAPEVWP